MASAWEVEGKHAGAFIVGEAAVGSTGVSRSRSTVNYVGAVAVGTSMVVRYDATSNTFVPYVNGTTAAANGVLFADVEAGDTTTQQAVLLLRDCEVNGAEIEFDPLNNAASILAGILELEAAGIIVRPVVE